MSICLSINQSFAILTWRRSQQSSKVSVLPFKIDKRREMYQPLGLRWEKTAATSVDQQQELINPKLADTLRTHTKFEPREWLAFGINELSPANFIRVPSDSGDQYFKPAVELSQHIKDSIDKDRWLALPGAQHYFDGAAMWNELLNLIKASTERYRRSSLHKLPAHLFGSLSE